MDFFDSTEVFPGVDIAGGVLYFLWEKDYKCDCEIVNSHKGSEQISTRPLNEFSTFIGYGNAVPII
ncbi:MAG: hypothetical protein ACK5NT_10950 [Pyrinomonadaceae bacterium]